MCLLTCVFSSLLPAQPSSAEKDPVLISNKITSIKLSEFRADLTRLPEEVRGGFINNRKRIDQALQNLLETKTIAMMAEKDGVADLPENATFLALERSRQLTQLAIEDLKKKWAEEFDNDAARFDARAREQYLLGTKSFTVPEKVKTSHMLFSTEKHSDEEAKRLAMDARKKVLDGENFAELAEKISESLSAQRDKGDLKWFSFGEMLPEFSKAAFALKEEGDISEPVKTKFGWHIIRFEGRTPEKKIPFEDAKARIMEELKKDYVAEQQNVFAAMIRKDYGGEINEDVVNASVFIAPLSGKEARELIKKDK